MSMHSEGTGENAYQSAYWYRLAVILTLTF